MVSAFGNVQQIFLPGTAKGLLYVGACAGLALIVARARYFYVTTIGLGFLLGLMTALTFQSLWAEDIGSVAFKTIGTGLLFVFLASVPALSPTLLVALIRYGAYFHVIGSSAVVALTSVGIHYGVGPGWVGWFDQKNFLGLTAAIACGTIAAKAAVERRIGVTTALVAAIAIVVLIMANSRGALLWLATFCGCFGLFLLGISQRLAVKLLLVLCLLLVAAIVTAPEAYLAKLAGFTTGRTALWEQARTSFSESPWIGHGLGSSYRSETRYFDAYGNVYRGMHNGFLAILIDTGAFGLCVYVFMILRTTRMLEVDLGTDANVLLSMLGAFIPYNFVESAIDKTTNISFVVFPLCIAACMYSRIRSIGGRSPQIALHPGVALTRPGR
jgi:O-antigen ligase